MLVLGSLLPTRLLAAAFLIIPLLLAGCLGESEPVEAEEEIPEGHGLVTIWMTRPDNAARNDVQALQAVPRFIAFNAGDQATADRLNSTGYVDVAKGWSSNADGWEDDEWPKRAQKDWLEPHAIWYQDVVPVGNYSQIRIEVIDQYMILQNSQPELRIGNTQVSIEGEPRIDFQPDPAVGAFQVEEGEELVLNFQSTLEQHEGNVFVVR